MPSTLPSAGTRVSGAHSTHPAPGQSAAPQGSEMETSCRGHTTGQGHDPLPGDCPPAVSPRGGHTCASDIARGADTPPNLRELCSQARADAHACAHACTHTLAALRRSSDAATQAVPERPQQTVHGDTSSPEVGSREAPRGPPLTQDPFHTQTYLGLHMQPRPLCQAPFPPELSPLLGGLPFLPPNLPLASMSPPE